MRPWTLRAFRNPILRLAVAVLCLTAPLCLAACGGGHSPTAPAPPLPQIAGSWNGGWAFGLLGLRATMQLTQADDGSVQGTLFIFPNTVNVAGTVSTASFDFHSVGSCLAVTGSLALTQKNGTVTQMSGTTSQDFAACGAPAGHPQVGRLDVSR